MQKFNIFHSHQKLCFCWTPPKRLSSAPNWNRSFPVDTCQRKASQFYIGWEKTTRRHFLLLFCQQNMKSFRWAFVCHPLTWRDCGGNSERSYRQSSVWSKTKWKLRVNFALSSRRRHREGCLGPAAISSVLLPEEIRRGSAWQPPGLVAAAQQDSSEVVSGLTNFCFLQPSLTAGPGAPVAGPVDEGVSTDRIAPRWGHTPVGPHLTCVRVWFSLSARPCTARERGRAPN